ncbi:protein deglycase HchA [Vespertiliibacter pulmonis]|uniref:Molecular chaperone Hsp31 and glyoxalase 3 n=1 Tax=Vespertiliibacter pulmonis TaxID=1443036 RepID=A0A3N4W3L4_9PAST|nr:glyoxalase III HchA [Vespertiliibacter pulmonis]QLB21360.1 protein deglycase HchA [Vespertiliibacter pulmonis]RPE85771.1 molecular chaperone Hsp31 and glyoxalase 3 [Vespertiliibacter pulmonis]
MTELSRQPVADRAEHNAFFPSEYSLSQYTRKVTDFDGFKFEKPYTGGKYKVLMIASDERYVEMQNGKLFSTGNHPVETLLPMLHIHHAGFEIDVVTLSGNSVKFEMWAMPTEDKAIMDLYQTYLPKFLAPAKLADILEEATSENSPYIAVLIPGGHGALHALPFSKDVKDIFKWALNKDKHIVTLCHGPAALLASSEGEKAEDYPFKGYEICVFPDALDEGANIEIGYMPGKLPWLLGERLSNLGVKIMNEGITGQVHKDRKLLTGDSPLASNNLGILAADELLKAVA